MPAALTLAKRLEVTKSSRGVLSSKKISKMFIKVERFSVIVTIFFGILASFSNIERNVLTDKHYIGLNMMHELYGIGIFTCLWFSCTAYSVYYDDYHDWDHLIFSQKWPATFCIYYTNYMTNPWRSCSLPENKLQWTIHGLWPNKLHGVGPFYCNTSVIFDKTKLQSIGSKLEIFWPNLEGDKSVDSLWQHEWEKHGTCTLNFEPLNSELKYFKGGLGLYSLYNMTSILSLLDVFPDKVKEYSVDHIIQRIEQNFNRKPYVECVKMRDTDKVYLSEIRLCFSKDFDMIDCEAKHFNSVTNCPQGETIIYPKDVKL